MPDTTSPRTPPPRARWRTTLVTLLTPPGGLAALLVPATQAHAATVTFTTGADRTDQNGNTLQLHGLGIIKVGSTWYGFGEDKTGKASGNTSFENITCYTSNDLGNWTYQRQALSRQTSGDLGPSRIVERPKVIYNKSTSTYVMYMHIDSTNYAEARVGVATSSTPCGPYTYRGSFRSMGNLSRDIGLFQDTDGTGYLLSEDRNNGLRIYRLSADYLSVDSAVAVLASGGSSGSVESPAMVKINGMYYVFGSHLTGWSLNDNVYATATSLSGSWSAFRNFAAPGTRTYGSQTVNVITVQGTAGTTYIYAGDRWDTSNLGASKLIWLPLTIRGTTANLGQYPAWSLDVDAGTWTAGSGPVGGGPHPEERRQLHADGRVERVHGQRRQDHPVAVRRQYQPAVDLHPGGGQHLHAQKRQERPVPGRPEQVDHRRRPVATVDLQRPDEPAVGPRPDRQLHRQHLHAGGHRQRPAHRRRRLHHPGSGGGPGARRQRERQQRDLDSLLTACLGDPATERAAGARPLRGITSRAGADRERCPLACQ